MNKLPRLGIKELRYLLNVPREERIGAIIQLNESPEFYHRIDVIRTFNDLERIQANLEQQTSR